jgi:hypothetical protein
MSIRMLWVKCTTSAECKPIQIAESSVMDGWKDHYIAQCSFGFRSGFQKNGGKCQTEYSEGTAVAWEKVRSTWRVLLRRWKWSCVIDLIYETKGLPPS